MYLGYGKYLAFHALGIAPPSFLFSAYKGFIARENEKHIYTDYYFLKS